MTLVNEPSNESLQFANMYSSNNQDVEMEIARNRNKEMSTCSLIIAVLGASIGNLLEWFDFVMFGLLANEIGKNFFPASNKSVQILSSFALFAGAFMMRPVGGVLFGYIGDKYGRIVSLQFSIFMMAIPTLLTGCLPNYSTIGVMAPILLTIFRLIQGISVGGEITGAITYILEVSPPKHKAFYIALVHISTCGVFLGTMFVGIMREIFTQQQMDTFMWRIPFLFGAIVGIFGIWMRKVLPPSGEFMDEKYAGKTLKNPTKEVLKNHKLPMITNVLHVMFQAAFYFLIWVWLPEYMYNKEINPIRSMYLISSTNTLINLCTLVVSGYIIDKYFNSNPTFILIIFGLITMIYTVIVFPFLNEINTVQILFIQMIWAIINGMYLGGWSLWSISRFKDNTVIRYSGFGIAYNISVALFGGTAPLIATLFILNYDTWILGLFLFCYAAISLSTNIISYFMIDKKSQNMEISATISEIEPLENR